MPHSIVLSWCNLTIHIYRFWIWKFTLALSFWSHFFVPILLDEKILLLWPFVFFSLSFSTQTTQFLPLVSFKKFLNWPKIRNGLLLQNNEIVMQGNFDIDIKIFTGKNFKISIVLIWYLPIVNLLSFLPVSHSIYFFVNDASYLTPQKKFLEDLRF